MSRLGSYRGEQVVKAFQRAGWRIARIRSSHVILEREGFVATLSVPVLFLKLLWKYSVDIFTVGNALTNNQALVLVYRDSDSVTADANFVLIRITGHTLKIP
jgi:predicted RNA binding protein YcfA (HicA-like mRNA interferase family)